MYLIRKNKQLCVALTGLFNEKPIFYAYKLILPLYSYNQLAKEQEKKTQTSK